MSTFPLESLETLHTLKGIYPCSQVTQCLEQLAKNDVLLLIESGVNNLLLPDFITQIKQIDVQVFALKDDTQARAIQNNEIQTLSHSQFVDLSIASQRIINWF